MEHSFSVTIYGKPTGKVLVKRQGLYYHFSCRCNLPEDTMYRLMVSCGTIRHNLGILVPEEQIFVLNTKLPVSRIGNGELSFTLVPKYEERFGIFVPIVPEEPFSYISRLHKAFLMIRDGQTGICIDQMQE